MVARLDKALYGLRESPLIWYNELGSKMRIKGYRSGEDPCVYLKGQVILLVYVDNILLLSPKEAWEEAKSLAKHLAAHYTLKEEFKWYLGIREVRYRAIKQIWRCQDGYIEKIASRFEENGGKVPILPIPVTEMVNERIRHCRGKLKPIRKY